MTKSTDKKSFQTLCDENDIIPSEDKEHVKEWIVSKPILINSNKEIGRAHV